MVHGSSAATVPADKSGLIASSMITGSTWLEYSGAPHALFFTEKDRLNQDLLRFIQQ